MVSNTAYVLNPKLMTVYAKWKQLQIGRAISESVLSSKQRSFVRLIYMASLQFAQVGR